MGMNTFSIYILLHHCYCKIVGLTAQKNETADLVIFTEEILNGKLRFLCSVYSKSLQVGLTVFLSIYFIFITILFVLL